MPKHPKQGSRAGYVEKMYVNSAFIAWRPPKKADENYEFASEVAEAITVSFCCC